MRTEHNRQGESVQGSAQLEFMMLDPDTFENAWADYLAENYEDSLSLVRQCLEEGKTNRPSLLSLVPDEGVPTLRDGVTLCARNLFQLDRFAEFEVLQASVGRWGLASDGFLELEVIELSFACKRGEYLEVVQHCSTFIEAHRRGLHPAIADFLYLRGLAHSHLGNPEKAHQDAEGAYSLFRVLQKDLESAKSANLLGILEFRSSSFEAAGKWFHRALEMHTRLGMRKNMGGNRLNLGVACYKQGLFAEAHSHFNAATRLFKDVEAQVSLCRVEIAQGNTYRLQRDLPSAHNHLMKAYEEANRLMLAREEALALEFLGDVARDEGQVENARRFYSRALAIGRSIAPEGDIVLEVLRRQGQCLQLLDRNTEALSVLGTARGMARRQGDRFEEGVILRTVSVTLLAMGDLDSAARHAARAVDLLGEVEAKFEVGKALLVAARVRQAQHSSGLLENPKPVLESAWQDAMSALTVFLKVDVEFWILAARKVVADLSERRAKQQLADSDPKPTGHGIQAVTTVEQPIIHVSANMRDLIQLCDAFADSTEPVLITGDTGTGKELFARRLHRQSGRRSRELVCVNATAIPRDIFAREFFGHVRGSFTGADGNGIGLAAQADGGTLFLDEIGEMPLELQPQLLRLLQDGTYQAIGDPSERRTNIRLIAATNANLEQQVAEGKFRADLYYRLKILELKLPPVVERREDIFPILKHFLAQASGRQVELSEFFNRASLELMHQHSWPGNVREIAMVARQAKLQLVTRGRVFVEVGNSGGGSLRFSGPDGVSDLGYDPDSELMAQTAASKSSGGRSNIMLALAETDGNRAEAARRLGVSRSTLYRRMEKLGILGKLVSS
ncbi:MAG: sigma 54-interacting transcriptional regulator [Gemmatimonadales bacterium]|nr:sigma 54-interacting transcriptional regulator [Gemmatimonadales bacterium]